jgi:DNA repair protein RadC
MLLYKYIYLLFDGVYMKKSSIKKWPIGERPREKLLTLGADKLSTCELLAILLQTGLNTKESSFSAVDLAKEILIEYKDLKGLINILPAELTRISGIGKAKASKLAAALELGRRSNAGKGLDSSSFKCTEEVAFYYTPILRDLKKEQFRLVLLDAKNRMIKEELISQGSLTSSIVHPREVINPAIRNSAASVIFLHNHPSGDPEPSLDDIEITRRLCKSFDIVGIKVLDHIIIGYQEYFSFRQKRLL